MKKRILCAVLSGIMLFPSVAFANDNIKIYLNGEEIIPLDENHQDAVVQDALLYLPLRNILESMGFSVTWDNSYQEVTGGLGACDYTVKIGNNVAIINGNEENFSGEAIIVNDRTLVTKDIIEACTNAEIEWIQNENKVNITYTPNLENIFTVDFTNTEGGETNE